MIDYNLLIHRARFKERYDIIPYLKYRMCKRIAYYTEYYNVFYPNGLAIKRTVEKTRKLKTNNFQQWLTYNNKRVLKGN